MLFRRFLPGLPPILAGDRLYLRAPEITDFAAWATLRAISRDHLQPWAPAWAADSLTREGYRPRLAWFDRLRRQAQGEAYFNFPRQHPPLLVGLPMSTLRRGP